MTPVRMTPSQFIVKRTGEDAETICALLADIQTLKEIDAAKDARIAELEAKLRKHEGESQKGGEE